MAEPVTPRPQALSWGESAEYRPDREEAQDRPTKVPFALEWLLLQGQEGQERGVIRHLPREAGHLPEPADSTAVRAFRDRIHGVRLVYDFQDDKIIGIAAWSPDSWSWQITRLETSAESQFRQAGINLLMDLAAQATGHVLARPTDLDQAVAAAEVADPRSVTLKLCNAAVQGLAHHYGLGVLAAELGALAEQALAPLIDPPDRLSRALLDMQILDMAIDAATGQLTPAVHDFAAAEIGEVIQDKTQGISQRELDEIQEVIKLCDQPGPEQPPEPPPPDPPDPPDRRNPGGGDCFSLELD